MMDWNVFVLPAIVMGLTWLSSYAVLACIVWTRAIQWIRATPEGKKSEKLNKSVLNYYWWAVVVSLLICLAVLVFIVVASPPNWEHLELVIPTIVGAGVVVLSLYVALHVDVRIIKSFAWVHNWHSFTAKSVENELFISGNFIRNPARVRFDKPEWKEKYYHQLTNIPAALRVFILAFFVISLILFFVR